MCSSTTLRLIQPGAINTDIWDRPGEDPARFDIPKEPPEIVAEGILAASKSDRFEHYQPDLKDGVSNKESDVDVYIAMLASMIAGSRK
jgi:hypothetical protein